MKAPASSRCLLVTSRVPTAGSGPEGAPATRIPLLLKEPARDLPTGISSLGTHRSSPDHAGGGPAVLAPLQCLERLIHRLWGERSGPAVNHRGRN